MKTNNSGGIGIAGLLGVVFVTLKLLGKIDWSWWYVTMPFYLPICIGIIAIIILVSIKR